MADFQGQKRFSEGNQDGLSEASRNPSSLSCTSLTSEGASERGHVALVVFGNAITSRMEASPVIIATNRSKPRAIPPWGGAP